MPSTYTVNLGIEKPATGEQSGTWGDTVNDNSNILDEAINGAVTITLSSAGSSGSPNSITITNGASSTGRNKWIEFDDGGDLGAAAYVQLTPNDAEKICNIRNSLSGSRSIFIFQGTYSTSNDLEIAAGTDVVVKFNGGGTGATVVNVYANLKVDGIVATTADINGGTIDATVIGGSTAAALTATTVVANTSVNIAGDGATVTGIKDEDNMASNSATKLATQQSIKAYVDSQVGTVDTLAEILANGNTTGSNDIDVDAAQKVQFRDAAIYINSSVDGQLDIVADTEIQIAATTIDINGAIVASGEISAASLDISGDVDIDGTLNVDAIDIDGAVQLDATLTVGVDDTGYDVKFYGATGGAYMLWDQSADDLILAGAGGLVVTGNVDFNGNLDVDGTTNLDVVDIDGAVDMASTLAVAGDANFDSGTLFVDVSANAVGIGTTSPSAKVDIFDSGAGNANSSGLELTNYDYGAGETGQSISIEALVRNDGGGTSPLSKIIFGKDSDYSSAAARDGNIQFYTNQSNVVTEAMRIDSSGNVGIGTTTVGQFASTVVGLTVDSGNAYSGIAMTDGATTSTLVQGYSTTYLYNQANGSLLFGTNNTERMRIGSSGNVLVGTTTTDRTADAGANIDPLGFIDVSRTSNVAARFTRLVDTGSLVLFRQAATQVGSISVTGSATAYNTSSDYRLKEDDVPMTGATERVKALRPINFAWKADGSRVDGFFAHELAEVVPEAATGTKDAMMDEEYEVTAAVYEDVTTPAVEAVDAVLDADGLVITEAVEAVAETTESVLVTEAVMGTRSVPDMQGIDQSKLVPLLTAALQEAIARIEALEAV